MAVSMVFKTKTKSAATSVKGKQTQPRSKTVKKSPMVPNVQSKTKTIVSPYSTYLKRNTNNNLHISAMSGKKNGIRVKGQVYVRDLYNFVRTDIVVNLSNTTVFSNVLYIHPEILTGRVALLAKAFNMYRFKEICLEFRGNYPVTQAGEVFISYCEDATMDPTLLQGRQIKSWVDTCPGSDSGPIYAQKSQKICADIKPEDDKWYTLSRNSQDVTDCYQGKFMVAISLAAIADFGELICSFDLELADDEVDVGEILNTLAVNQGAAGYSRALRFQAQTVTDLRAPLKDVTIIDDPAAVVPTSTSFSTGVYSVMVQDPATANLSISRQSGWRAGIDLVGTIVQFATGVPVLRLFDSFAALASGNQTNISASITAAVNSGWCTFTRLLGDDGTASGTTLSPDHALLKIKGFADHYSDVKSEDDRLAKQKVQTQSATELHSVVPISPVYGRNGEPYQGRSQEQNYTGFRLGSPM